jgi:hypothetical protein
MAFRLKEDSITAAIRHLGRYGDTDIFPHLPELIFFVDEEAAVVGELAKLDLDSYNPAGAMEALAPKGKYSFRVAHQLPALDTLLFLACTIELGDAIESRRQPISSRRAFSYRYKVDLQAGTIFAPDRTYKDWLHRQQALIEETTSIKQVVSTDISDFYARINFHRMENLLDEAASSSGAARFVKRHIRVIRAKQSFGLPVGGSAARLLAELSLADTDQALKDKKFIATRFVDDFRIFLKSGQDVHEALAYLAEQLGINEGLSLNAAKTMVTSRRDYLQRLERLTTDVEEEAEGVAIDALTSSIYFDDEPDEDEVTALKGVNLLELLDKEINAETQDVGRIKVMFRALKIVKPVEAIIYIKKNFSRLVLFSKDLCLLMEALDAEYPGRFNTLGSKILAAVKAQPAASVLAVRAWLLELFVRGVVGLPKGGVAELESLRAISDKRQLLFIRGRLDEKNYFRQQKTQVDHFTEAERSALVWGASCLPKDEYENWLEIVKASFSKPLGLIYLRWASKSRKSLNAKLKAKTLDHAE